MAERVTVRPLEIPTHNNGERRGVSPTCASKRQSRLAGSTTRRVTPRRSPLRTGATLNRAHGYLLRYCVVASWAADIRPQTWRVRPVDCLLRGECPRRPCRGPG